MAIIESEWLWPGRSGVSIQVTPVVLCGGSGTRLWPLSRTGFPKQFLCLTGEQSLFQLAVHRLLSLEAEDIEVAQPLIVTNEEHRFLASEQLREAGISPAAMLLEPVGKNTAPALTLAALAAIENGQDPILVVTPADQIVADQQAFQAAMQLATREAQTGSIVILGINPDAPETGYGYIQAETKGGAQAFSVRRFVEKPDQETAQQYLKEGGYYWNAGMFVLKASVWLKALQTFRPDIAHATEVAWVNRSADTNSIATFVRPEKVAFSQIPAESVDYAVMERCPGSSFPITMVPLNAGWSDLGAWDAVWNVLPKDGNGNVHRGDVLATDSTNTFVHATSRLVGLVGVQNIVVIETADAVMVADKSCCQEVKAIVSNLQSKGRAEQALHRKVSRPWGWYDSVDMGERFQVKRIGVKPGASLSLQRHNHRAEHWVVVKGTAEVTRGTETFVLSENQSTYIPIGELHRLRNPADTELEIIEVQSGAYLGEDDIVRFDDTYGRVAN